jgi:hypothetical protein
MHPYQDQGLVEWDEGDVRLSSISIRVFIVFVGCEYTFLLRLMMTLGVEWWNPLSSLPGLGTWSRLGIERQKDGGACIGLYLPAAEKGEKDVMAAP